MDVKNSYLYDYKNTYLIAATVNANFSSIAYTSFEADGKGNWTFSGTPITEYKPPTGDKAYDLENGSISKTSLDNSKTYIVSYWAKNVADNVNRAMNVNNIPYEVKGVNIYGWQYYQHRISNTSTVTISGSGTIDEVRLYPVDAQMTTYTYAPLVGLTSQCSINNDISYYEYDAFGRLKLIRDQNRKILKQYCYTYAGKSQSCAIAEDVNVQALNQIGVSGFTATYTNENTNEKYGPFNISMAPGPRNLCTIPPGNYKLEINKFLNSTNYTFGPGCGSMTTDGTSATFYNISVSPSNCNRISISY